MTDIVAPTSPPRAEPPVTPPVTPPAEPPVTPPAELSTGEGAVGGPVRSGWREGTLTRAQELESLCDWVVADNPRPNYQVLVESIRRHLKAAREAAKAAPLDPKRAFRIFRNGSLLERAMSNLDAAEAQLLNIASAEYVLGQLPSLLRDVQCHLLPTDPRRQELERIARKLGMNDPDLRQDQEPSLDDQISEVDDDRGRIVTAKRAASSAALREQVRVRSFRNVLVVAILLMTLLTVGVAIAGWLRPTMIPLCFSPEEAGQAVVVCPTAQSAPFSTSPEPGTDNQPSTALQDIDDAIEKTVTPQDLLVVELVGLTAAAVAAAAAIRGIRGSSERHGVPIALALIKLPTGALTAFLGLLLMRGQFVPGLSALDTSAQILAWALVFGYAQQLFTRLVDRQGHTVLETVRGADKPQPSPSPP